MLYDLTWLEQNKPFPPAAEVDRIRRYRQNEALFDGDHFESSIFRHRGNQDELLEMYSQCARRISRVIGNFEDVISFPVLLNYQRLLSLKTADLVCGEYPTITGSDEDENAKIKAVRDYAEIDRKLYSAVIDISRYGDAVERIYKDSKGNFTVTMWDPKEWYPIVAQDGTLNITHHCLCWIVDENPSGPYHRYFLHVQIHEVDRPGVYEQRVYQLDSYKSTIGKLVQTKTVHTGLEVCAVRQLKSFSTTNTVYGYDDYMTLDSILAEIMARIGQISVILDKHADPNITGPVSMLSVNSQTGEYYLKPGKFFAVSPGDTPPAYMTWDGQLSSAFKELEVLINQLYILSEMGSAILGDSTGGSQAVSGTAMRFKMAGPLSKARRIVNSLTLPVRELLSVLTETIPTNFAPAQLTPGRVPLYNVAIKWSDGLPDDPREQVEIAKLATGATKMMPLVDAIMEYFGKSNEEAQRWVELINEENLEMVRSTSDDPNHAGPQNGTGVNPRAKGSTTGLNAFKGQQNYNQTTGKSKHTSNSDE